MVNLWLIYGYKFIFFLVRFLIRALFFVSDERSVKCCQCTINYVTTNARNSKQQKYYIKQVTNQMD